MTRLGSLQVAQQPWVEESCLVIYETLPQSAFRCSDQAHTYGTEWEMLIKFI